MDGIGPHEAERIDQARQLVVAAFFDRRQVGAADAQRRGGGLDIGAIGQARLAQQLADRVAAPPGLRLLRRNRRHNGGIALATRVGSSRRTGHRIAGPFTKSLQDSATIADES